MTRLALLAATAAVAPSFVGATPALAAGPLQITNTVLMEKRVAAADGTVRIVTQPGNRAKPGDHMVVSLAYRNTGRQPIGDLVLADPVPKELTYRAAADGSPSPDVSVDGQRFAPLAALSVALPGGGSRPATGDDVVAVRWRLPAPVAPGAGGTLAFKATLK